MKTISLARTAALAFALAGYAGCADQETPGTPTGSSASSAQEQALAAVQMVDQLVADSHALAAGDLTGFAVDTIELPHRVTYRAPELHGPRAADSPIWDGGQGAWVYAQSVTDDQGTISVSAFIQFLDGTGAWQTEPDGTTDRIRYAVSLDMHVRGEDERSSEPVDLDFSFEQDLEIAELQSAVWQIGGGGSMTGSVEGRTDGRRWDYSTAMEWGAALTVPADGSTCASGTVSVSVDDWSVVATYDAVAQAYAWAMYENGGSAPVATGTGTSACSTF